MLFLGCARANRSPQSPSIRVFQATPFRWKRQAPLNAGVVEGVAIVDADELAATHKRITALEAELALTRDACGRFNDTEQAASAALSGCGCAPRGVAQCRTLLLVFVLPLHR
jgi:hypothetical protein